MEENRNPVTPKRGRNALVVLLVAGSMAAGGLVGAVLVGHVQSVGAAPAATGQASPAAGTTNQSGNSSPAVQTPSATPTPTATPTPRPTSTPTPRPTTPPITRYPPPSLPPPHLPFPPPTP
jgi:hypothetical protein